MVDELNEAAGALLRAHRALKEAARLHDGAEALFNQHELTLRRMSSDLTEFRMQWVEEDESGD
jgi:hypothetical protein